MSSHACWQILSRSITCPLCYYKKHLPELTVAGFSLPQCSTQLSWSTSLWYHSCSRNINSSPLITTLSTNFSRDVAISSLLSFHFSYFPTDNYQINGTSTILEHTQNVLFCTPLFVQPRLSFCPTSSPLEAFPDLPTHSNKMAPPGSLWNDVPPPTEKSIFYRSVDI